MWAKSTPLEGAGKSWKPRVCTSVHTSMKNSVAAQASGHVVIFSPSTPANIGGAWHYP
jgi:hypothetical protein